MFDTDEKISRILGNGMGQGTGNQRQGLGFGRGLGPKVGEGFKRANFNINPNTILFEIQKLFDRLPDVKSAKGNLTIQLADGQVKVLKLEYNE